MWGRGSGCTILDRKLAQRCGHVCSASVLCTGRHSKDAGRGHWPGVQGPEPCHQGLCSQVRSMETTNYMAPGPRGHTLPAWHLHSALYCCCPRPRVQATQATLHWGLELGTRQLLFSSDKSYQFHSHPPSNYISVISTIIIFCF